MPRLFARTSVLLCGLRHQIVYFDQIEIVGGLAPPSPAPTPMALPPVLPPTSAGTAVLPVFVVKNQGEPILSGQQDAAGLVVSSAIWSPRSTRDSTRATVPAHANSRGQLCLDGYSCTNIPSCSFCPCPP